MSNRPVWYLAFAILGVLLLGGLQQLLYPFGTDLSYEFIRSFGSDRLQRPVGIAFAGGRVYVTDTGNDRMVVFTPTGKVLGTGGRTGSETGEFRRPMRPEVGPEGNIYVADLLNDRVQVFTPRGNLIRTHGKNGDVEASFNQPGGVDVDSDGNLYVVEFMGQRVQKISPEGKQLATWGVKNTKGFFHYGYFNYPTDVAVANNGRFYVSDTFNDRVKHYGPSGSRLDVWGGFFGLNIPGPFRGWFKGAYGLAVTDDAEKVFVTDWGNNRMQVFDRDGDFLTAFGSGGKGPGEMNQPTDVAVGENGFVYVMDFANDRVQIWRQTNGGTES
jgi:DNA-binding beta-propeller fold protein YncE